MPADIKATHALYGKSEAKWMRINTCLLGEDAIKEAKETYLPFPLYSDSLDRKSEEFIAEYGVYLAGAHFTNYTLQASEDLVSAVFRADMIVSKNPDKLEYIDLETTARDIVKDVSSYGRVGLFIDYPTTDDPTQEQDTENFAYMEVYNTLDIINWKTVRRGGIKTLSMVTLREIWYNDLNEPKHRYRELVLEDGIYKVRVYADEDHLLFDEFIPQANGTTLDHIPFYFIGAISNTSDPDEPPIIGIANSNIKHYQTWAELNHVQTYMGHPMLAITGAPNGFTKKAKDEGVTFTVGARQALVMEGDAAAASVLQAPDAGGIHFKTLAQLEKSMIDQGAKLKSGDQKNSAETENTLKIRHSSETSILASIAKNVEAGLESAMRDIGLFMGVELPADFDIQLNKEYLDPAPDAGLIGALNTAVTSGNYTKESFTNYLQQVGLVDEDKDVAAVVAELGETDPFNVSSDLPSSLPGEVTE